MGSQSRAPRAERGVTLMEMLVVTAILAVVALLVAPAFSALGIVASTRADAARLLASIHLARAEAVRSGSTALLCPAAPSGLRCGENYDAGWLVLAAVADAAGGPQVLRQELPGPGGLRVRRRDGLRAVATPVRLLRDGSAVPAATFRFCAPPASAVRGWSLVLSSAGRPRLQRDAEACP